MTTTTKPPTCPAGGKADPPGRPPTDTATGAMDAAGAAFGLVVPIPPGWQVGALELVTGNGHPDGPAVWRRTLQTHAVHADRSPVSSAAGEAPVPAHATALAIGNAWALYQAEHPSGSEAAAHAGCRVPHPQPAGGIRTKTYLRPDGRLPVRVTLPNPLTLTATVPELVRLDAAPVNDARRRIQGEPVRVAMTCDLSAVGEDWNGNLRPLAELTDPTPPELRGGATSFGGTVVRIDMDEATVVANIANKLRGLEAELGRRVREIMDAARGAVSFSTTGGEGFVPAYAVRRRAENLAPGATPVGLTPAFHGHVEFHTVRGDQCGAIWPAVCRYTTAVATGGPPSVMLSSFYRPESAVSNL